MASTSLTYAGNGFKIVISPTPLPPEGNGNFVGSEKCAPCHDDIYKRWLSSPHAQAYKTLEKKQAQQEASCLRCHSTGYGKASGFIDFKKTPHLAGVQCESCHGAASKHLAQKATWGRLKANCPTCQTRKICMTCHTLKHSPNFNLNSYLEKIRHP